MWSNYLFNVNLGEFLHIVLDFDRQEMCKFCEPIIYISNTVTFFSYYWQTHHDMWSLWWSFPISNLEFGAIVTFQRVFGVPLSLVYRLDTFVYSHLCFSSYRSIKNSFSYLYTSVFLQCVQNTWFDRLLSILSRSFPQEHIPYLWSIIIILRLSWIQSSFACSLRIQISVFNHFPLEPFEFHCTIQDTYLNLPISPFNLGHQWHST